VDFPRNSSTTKVRVPEGISESPFHPFRERPNVVVGYVDTHDVGPHVELEVVHPAVGNPPEFAVISGPVADKVPIPQERDGVLKLLNFPRSHLVILEFQVTCPFQSPYTSLKDVEIETLHIDAQDVDGSRVVLHEPSHEAVETVYGDVDAWGRITHALSPDGVVAVGDPELSHSDHISNVGERHDPVLESGGGLRDDETLVETELGGRDLQPPCGDGHRLNAVDNGVARHAGFENFRVLLELLCAGTRIDILPPGEERFTPPSLVDGPIVRKDPKCVHGIHPLVAADVNTETAIAASAAVALRNRPLELRSDLASKEFRNGYRVVTLGSFGDGAAPFRPSAIVGRKHRLDGVQLF